MKDHELSHRGDTRVEIIQAACHLFLENGYHGTSMRKIAQAAGIALGGIYNHFDSKEEIFTTIFLEHHPYKEMLAQINGAQGDTLDDLFHDAARRLNDSLMDRPDEFLKLMFIELVEFRAEHIRELFQQIYPQLEVFANRFFTNRRELRDLPVMVIMRAFLGLFFSYFMTEWLFADLLPEEARDNALQHFVDIYLHGILKSEHS